MAERRSRVSWIWRIIVGTVAVVIAVGMWWHHYINRQYSPGVPVTRMPSPNASDYYVRAANSIVDSYLVGWAIRDTPSPRPAPPKPFVPLTPAPRPVPPTLATIDEQEMLLQRNSQCLDTLRSGFHHAYLHPPVTTIDELVKLPPPFVKLSSLLILESEVHQRHGDWRSAMGSLVDSIRLGSDIVRGSCRLDSESEEIQRRSVRLAWKMVDQLDACSSRTLSQEMDSIIDGAWSYADILREDKQTMLSVWCSYFDRPDWQSELTKCFADCDARDDAREIILCFTRSRYSIFATYSIAMDRIIFDTRKPYAENLPAPPITKDRFYGWLLGSYSDGNINTVGRSNWECTTATTRLLTLSLALHAYYLDHGSYPASLKALTPSYLSKLPDDPFALKGTFKYKCSGSDYTLYSLGPDCRDDGGKAIGKPGHRDVKMGSKGDIVAGVNY